MAEKTAKKTDLGGILNFDPSNPPLIYGFSAEQLGKLALILRELRIDPHDLKRILTDFESTYKLCDEHIRAEWERMFRESVKLP